MVLYDLDRALGKVDLLQVGHVELLENVSFDEWKVVASQVQDLSVRMESRDVVGQGGVDTLHRLLAAFPLAHAEVWAGRPACHHHQAKPQAQP